MEFKLKTPLLAKEIENLHVRDIVFLDGKVYTARDKVHALIHKKGSPISLEGAVIYHCGPLIRGDFVLENLRQSKYFPREKLFRNRRRGGQR